MNFALTDDQQEFRALCRRFAEDVVRPVAARHDAEESTPWDVIREARGWGLQGIDLIQRFGADPDGQLGVIYAEELHWGCAGIALALSGSSLAAAGIAASGTPEQIARWVPECFGTDDDVRLGAYAVTEPQAGSDVKSLRTTARLDGDEWVLNGTKVFITNGGIADVHVVVATVDPELGHRGQAAFVVPKGTPGIRQGKKESKLGIRASHTAEVVLEDCRVPVEHLLGGMDKLQRKLERARSGQSSGRASNALATFELTRPIVGASAIGIAQAAYEWTLEHLDGGGVITDPLSEWLDESSTAGRPPLERQAVQQRIADVATEIDAARLLVQRAAWMGRNGIPLSAGQGSMSKLKGGDVAMWATRTCMDLVGPAAGVEGCPLEKWFRDAKIYQLFEGTAEIQRLVISRLQVAEYRQRLELAADAMHAAETTTEADAAHRDGSRNGGPPAGPVEARRAEGARGNGVPPGTVAPKPAARA
jgi:acyl-CoA dehydrogenase